MVTPLPPVDVAPVVVLAPRLPSLAGEAVFSARQIDIQAIASAPRLDAVLKTVPGVSLFRRTGSDGANPTIQGISLRSIAPSGAGRALVTLDGVPVNDPFGGWVIWSGLMPEALQGAKIVRGAGAGAYGAGALTGVVALRSREGAADDQYLSGEFGTSGLKRIVGRSGAQGILVVGGIESSDGYTPVRGMVAGAADVPTKFNSANLSAQIQGEVQGTQGSIRIGGYNERRSAGLLGANSVSSGADLAVTLARLQRGSGGRIQVWARQSDLANTSVAVASGRATTTQASDQYSTPALGYGVNAAWQARGSIWSWEAGGDLRFASGRAFERFRFQNGAFTRNRESGGETADGGVYLDVSRDDGPLILTAGVRLDAWKQGGAVRVERDISTGAVVLNNPSVGASGLTPTGRFGVKWSFAENVWLRSAAYSGFRTPTLNELHRPFRVGNDVTEANPTLVPEILNGVEFGLGGEGRTDWSISAFYNEIRDPVANVTLGVGPKTFPVAGFIPAGGALRQRQNVGSIEAAGIEGELARAIGPVRMEAAWAYTRARVNGGAAAPQLSGKRPAQAPVLTVTAGLKWDLTPVIKLSSNARYESQRFEDDLNTRVLAASVSVDARGEWRMNERVSLFIAAENLTNTDIVVGQTGDGVNSYAAPRSVRLGLSIR